ncbi:MAG: POT-type proton-dependent oligopeptide transporter [Planctomycetota bacterium]|jgi:POT family proton-dependent oligopeptide transporter
MTKRTYLTAPPASKKIPAGIPYILTNEAAERFAFYGMTSILVVFMTKYLMGRDGTLAAMTDEGAKEWFHIFTAAVYFTPLIGAILSDMWLGKYRTIVAFSILYCAGFAFLVWDQTRLGLGAGLVLIALGSGMIKPCVSANVGDQFGQQNKHLLSKMYSWFYFSINVGACISMFACPWLLDKYGPRLGFGVPALLMIFATIAFVAGRMRYVHIPPEGKEKVLAEIFDWQVFKILVRLCIIFVFVSMFFALFYQSQGAWVLQAERMNLKWFITWLPAQIQAVNSALIIIMIPLFAYVVYPAMDKVFPLTPLRKIGIGMFVTAACFIVPAFVETQIKGGDVFKCSSRSIVSGLEPLCLVDGLSEDAGWSSGSQPTREEPVEIVLRLRQRKAWSISSVELDLSATLSPDEIIAALERLGDRQNAASAGASMSLQSALDAAISVVKQAETLAEAKAEATDVLQAIGQDARELNEANYRPCEISVFAQDFTDRLTPKLFTETEEEDASAITDVKQWTVQQGWKHVGDLSVAEDQTAASLDFEPTTATHVLIQIASNHGADHVKIAELRVATTEPLSAGAKQATAEIWPNVAGLGFRPSIGWQFFAYILLTAGEILASIAVLEFSYTQAPKKVKSFVMSLYLLAISLGNFFSAAVNHFIQNEDGSTKLPGAGYYWFFAIAMLITLALYIPVAMRFPVREYIQDDAPPESEQ